MKVLRNYMEDAVRAYVDRWYPETDVCQCDSCKLDVMALMLNYLKPQYVVTDQGALYAQMNDFDPQFKADLMTAIGYAVEKVRNRPKHSRE